MEKEHLIYVLRLAAKLSHSIYGGAGVPKSLQGENLLKLAKALDWYAQEIHDWYDLFEIGTN